MFGDPRLQRLIELALHNNRDLRLATLNVEAVQAQYNIQRAARLPSVSTTAGVTRQRTAADSRADPATPGRLQTQHTLDRRKARSPPPKPIWKDAPGFWHGPPMP